MHFCLSNTIWLSILVRRYLGKSGIYHILFLVVTFTLNKYLRIILSLHSVSYVNCFFVSFQVTILDNKPKTVTREVSKVFFLCTSTVVCHQHQEQANGSYPVWVILCVIWCLDCKSDFIQEGIISFIFSLLSPQRLQDNI